MKRLTSWLVALTWLLAMGGAQAADVLLGPGDVVKVTVYNNPDLGVEARIGEDGNLSFPLLGQVAVAGLAPSAAERKISQLLEKGGFLKQAQVNMLVTLLQSQQVSVLGAVNHPGRYPIDGKRSVFDLLALAGGFNADAGDTVSLMHRGKNGTTKDIVDVVDMVRNGNTKSDVDLAGGDIIYVERSPRFYIYGEVQRPGVFRLERAMTVLQALSVGGGLTQRGTERGVRIKRRGDDGKMQIISAKHDDLLKSDDVVYVQESLF